MKTYELHIKNMVCERCVIYVMQVLQQLNTPPQKVELGRVIFSSPCDTILPTLEKKLREVGLQVVYDKTEVTVEEIKIHIIKLVVKPSARHPSGSPSCEGGRVLW